VTQPTFKKIMFDDLKKRGRQDLIEKIKSVRYKTFSMGDAVDVDTLDCLPEQIKFLDSFCKEYQHGYFNGMDEIYEYCEKDKPRTAKYVHAQHEFSPLHRKAAENLLARKYLVTDNDTAQARLNMWFDNAVNRILYNGSL